MQQLDTKQRLMPKLKAPERKAVVQHIITVMREMSKQSLEDYTVTGFRRPNRRLDREG